jgi:hypothetical protein
MKLLPHHGCARGLAALGGFLLSVTVHAQSFQPTVQGRWVQPVGDAVIVGQDGQAGTGKYNVFQPAPDFGPFIRTGTLHLDVAAPDATAAAHLRGSVSHTSSIDPEAIRYEGSVALSSTTSGTPGPGSYVNANGESFFGLMFDVATPLSVVLSLHADLAGRGEVNFNFIEENETRPSIFSERAISFENGTGRIVPRELTFALSPGHYNLSMRLDSYVPSLEGVAAATAGFSLIAAAIPAIPEPQAWLMLVAGLPLLGVMRGRTSRTPGIRPRHHARIDPVWRASMLRSSLI